MGKAALKGGRIHYGPPADLWPHKISGLNLRRSAGSTSGSDCAVKLCPVAFESSDLHFFEICFGKTNAFNYGGPSARLDQFNGIANIRFWKRIFRRLECDTTFDLYCTGNGGYVSGIARITFNEDVFFSKLYLEFCDERIFREIAFDTIYATCLLV